MVINTWDKVQKIAFQGYAVDGTYLDPEIAALNVVDSGAYVYSVYQSFRTASKNDIVFILGERLDIKKSVIPKHGVSIETDMRELMNSARMAVNVNPDLHYLILSDTDYGFYFPLVDGNTLIVNITDLRFGMYDYRIGSVGVEVTVSECLEDNLSYRVLHDN